MLISGIWVSSVSAFACKFNININISNSTYETFEVTVTQDFSLAQYSKSENHPVNITSTLGGIGVMNVMLVSVTKRTKEIGIRRVLGTRQGDIQFQFLIESVMLCIVGGFMGLPQFFSKSAKT